VLKRRDDEVVVFHEFFYAGLRISVISFVLEVPLKFGVRFHQWIPRALQSLLFFVWACKSQGVEVDLDAFVRTHRVCYPPKKVAEDGATSMC
jgi:hypothetical protein